MLQNIQALRGLAAVAVVLFHAVPHYRAMGGFSEVFPLIAGFGYTGVDVFFIISGYVMALTTVSKERNSHNARAFLQKRLFRIYLGYWPFFLLLLLIIGIVRAPKLAEYNLISSFFLTSTDMSVLPLSISWSLTYELFFYSLVFLLFAFNLANAHRMLAGFFLLILVVNLFWQLILHPVSRFFLSPFILEFIAGYFLYALLQRERSIAWGVGFSILCIGGYVLGFQLNAQNGFTRVYSFGIGAFGLMALAIWVEKKSWFRFPALMGRLGDASYVIYLCHLPLLNLFYFLGIRDWLAGQGGVVAELGFALFILAVLLFSLLFHYKIEHPLYKTMLDRFHIRASSSTYPCPA